jgi:hypothetical protein
MFGTRFPDFEVWRKKLNATVIGKFQLNLRAGSGPADWYLLEIHKPQGSVSTL